MLKFTNHERTCAVFNGAGITLAAPGDWSSIGDAPTRDAVAKWLAEGNTPEPADPSPTPDYSAMRAQAYREESDPLFFKSQRGEATREEWLGKVAEIKARWPTE